MFLLNFQQKQTMAKRMLPMAFGGKLRIARQSEIVKLFCLH
jgi:hypothetical protein